MFRDRSDRFYRNIVLSNEKVHRISILNIAKTNIYQDTNSIEKLYKNVALQNKKNNNKSTDFDVEPKGY